MNEQSAALTEVLPDVKRAAKHVSLEWADVVEQDDLEQEISLRLLEKKYATTVRDMEERPRRQVLYRIGQQVASQERVDYEHFTGQYRYSTDEVRERLSKGALKGVGTTEAGAGAETFVVEDVDIRKTFVNLEKHHQEVIFQWLTSTESMTSTDRKRVTRAIDTLTHELNRAFRRGWEEHDGPGARKAISNSAAQVLVKKQEQEG